MALARQKELAELQDTLRQAQADLADRLTQIAADNRFSEGHRRDVARDLLTKNVEVLRGLRDLEVEGQAAVTEEVHGHVRAWLDDRPKAPSASGNSVLDALHERDRATSELAEEIALSNRLRLLEGASPEDLAFRLDEALAVKDGPTIRAVRELTLQKVRSEAHEPLPPGGESGPGRWQTDFWLDGRIGHHFAAMPAPVYRLIETLAEYDFSRLSRLQREAVEAVRTGAAKPKAAPVDERLIDAADALSTDVRQQTGNRLRGAVGPADQRDRWPILPAEGWYAEDSSNPVQRDVAMLRSAAFREPLAEPSAQ